VGDFPIFSAFDKKEPYEERMGLPIGEYYLNIKLVMARGNFVRHHGWYPRNVILHCLERKYITIENITHVIIASRSLAVDTFKAWVIKLRKAFPRDFKSLVNHYIGGLGTQFHKETESAKLASRSASPASFTLNKLAIYAVS
jgi:hypothetical protein